MRNAEPRTGRWQSTGPARLDLTNTGVVDYTVGGHETGTRRARDEGPWGQGRTAGPAGQRRNVVGVNRGRWQDWGSLGERGWMSG